MDQRPSPKQFIFTKEIGPYDEQMTTNMLLAEMAAAVKEHFKITKTEGDPENEVAPTVSISFVGIHPEDYEDLREIEWNYKQEHDESDPDNAHEEGEE